jgi:hypothetical protein
MHTRTQHPLPAAHAVFALIVGLVAGPETSHGWVYPEHREITLRAVQKLSPRDSTALARLWVLARTGYESRLSPLPVDTSGSLEPTAIDFAAWPAISGDHSCSAADMLGVVLTSDWILQVAGVGASLRRELSEAGLERHSRTNALRDSDLRLQHVDPQYVTRAGANSAHFLLARPYPDTDLGAYTELCLASGCELNAVGVYAWYHLSALRKMERLARGMPTDSQRVSLARSALADEAFALHFLQDIFAAGHVAGTRGDASQRKGTHDYYNEFGLEVHTWDGKSMILKGDAWMRPNDAGRAAVAIHASLTQFLSAGEGGLHTFRLHEPRMDTPDTMNCCRLEVMPARELEHGLGTLLTDIMRSTPVPGLSEGEGELPRFRSEIGPFVGIVPAMRGAILQGAFGEGQVKGGVTGGLEMAVRLGLGLDGVLNESGDGLVFFDLGARLEAPSSMRVNEDELASQFGTIFAAIPSRGGLIARVRIPFYLIPFDLLLAAPVLLPAAPDTYTQMATIAGNGGLIPWQTGIATSFGRFQFILGREVGATFFGYLGTTRLILPVGEGASEGGVLASLRSIQLDFPVLEYMPFHMFSSDQSSSMVIQLMASVDIPTRVVDVYPAGFAVPETNAVWQIGVRAAFRWRHYW